MNKATERTKDADATTQNGNLLRKNMRSEAAFKIKPQTARWDYWHAYDTVAHIAPKQVTYLAKENNDA